MLPSVFLSVCKEVSSGREERGSSLVQEEPQPPHHEEGSPGLVKEEPQPLQIKEEQDEEDYVSTLTLLHRNTRCNTLSGKLSGEINKYMYKC